MSATNVTLKTLSEATGVLPIRATEEQLGMALLDATHDSRAVDSGFLFCAIPGAVSDGHKFTEKAQAQGAVALLVEHEVDVDLPQFVVSDSRAAMGTFASAIQQNPSAELSVVGVTGTNGKSSFIQILSDIWAAANVKSDIYGTVGGKRTTPESTDLQRMLRASADRGCTSVAMEVSSHALTLGRVVGTTFAAAVFTNLGHDHLDFHGTLENYYRAKASLFTSDAVSVGIINVDDAYGARLAQEVDLEVLAYSLADAKELSVAGTTTSFRWRDVPVEFHLAGLHNVSNALAAATVAARLGIELETIADGLCATSPVRGRFEFVDIGQPFTIAVDYAHTPDALAAVLRAGRTLSGDGQIILVFGCGGDRDTEKRPAMGRVAEELADITIITSDNPRSEDPSQIGAQIVAGFTQPSQAILEFDRKVAIQCALGKASPGDLVLVAGKGHETEQIIGDVVSHFDDREAVLQALGEQS